MLGDRDPYLVLLELLGQALVRATDKRIMQEAALFEKYFGNQEVTDEQVET